jgi:hypothetical protein
MISPQLSPKILTCVDCSMPLIGKCQRCPACNSRHVVDSARSSSIWHGLVAWFLLAELLAIGGILLAIVVKGCL